RKELLVPTTMLERHYLIALENIFLHLETGYWERDDVMKYVEYMLGRKPQFAHPVKPLEPILRAGRAETPGYIHASKRGERQATGLDYPVREEVLGRQPLEECTCP